MQQPVLREAVFSLEQYTLFDPRYCIDGFSIDGPGSIDMHTNVWHLLHTAAAAAIAAAIAAAAAAVLAATTPAIEPSHLPQ